MKGRRGNAEVDLFGARGRALALHTEIAGVMHRPTRPRRAKQRLLLAPGAAAVPRMAGVRTTPRLRRRTSNSTKNGTMSESLSRLAMTAARTPGQSEAMSPKTLRIRPSSPFRQGAFSCAIRQTRTAASTVILRNSRWTRGPVDPALRSTVKLTVGCGDGDRPVARRVIGPAIGLDLDDTRLANVRPTNG